MRKEDEFLNEITRDYIKEVKEIIEGKTEYKKYNNMQEVWEDIMEEELVQNK